MRGPFSTPITPLPGSLFHADPQGLLSAVGAVGAPPAADDARLVAATKLIGFIGELAAEQRKVGDVRSYLEVHNGEVKEVITGLDRNLRIWEIARKADAALRSGIAASIAQAVLSRQPPAPAIERRDTLREFYARQREASSQAALYPALSNALVELGAANDDLSRVIRRQPTLNARERAIVAELARKRLIRAMDGIAALVNAFPGV